MGVPDERIGLAASTDGDGSEADASHEHAQPARQLPASSAKLLLVAAALVLTQTLFAGLSVIAKPALQYTHPLVFAFLRESLAGPLLAILGFFIERAWPRRADWWRLLLLGLTGVWGNQLFVFLGLYYTSPLQVAIMQPSTPVFAAALSLAAGLEPFSALKLLGVAAAGCGAVVMVGLADFGLGSARTVGTACLLVNCLSTAAYLVLQRPLLARYPPISLTAWAYLAGAALMGLTLALYNLLLGPTPSLWHPPRELLLPLLYAVLAATVLTYSLLSWANQHTSATVVAASWTLQPLASAVLSYIFLAQLVVLRQVAGAALILTGLALVLWQRHREAAAAAQASAPADEAGATPACDSGGEDAPHEEPQHVEVELQSLLPPSPSLAGIDTAPAPSRADPATELVD